MFGFMKKAKEIGNKYTGNTDFLEALCAASALVVVADGVTEESEVESSLETIKSHKAIAAAFSVRAVEVCFETMLTRAKTIPGKLSLKREINDVAQRGDKELAEDIFATALEVAGADGSIADAELKVLADIANRLGVNARDFGL